MGAEKQPLGSDPENESYGTSEEISAAGTYDQNAEEVIS